MQMESRLLQLGRRAIATSRLAVLAILLLASTQAFPHSSEVVRSPVIGQEFDTEKIPVIEELLGECHILDTFKQPLTDECIDRLANYFSLQPVWAQSMLYLPSFDRNRYRGCVLNRRPYTLAYSRSDITGDVPFWNDIFDENVEERRGVTKEVLQDAECMQLSKPGAIRNVSDFSTRCQSRELVKYAIYLDACKTSLKRIDHLLVERVGRDRTTRFNDSMNQWNHHNRTERTIHQAHLKETILQAVWLRNACSDNSETMYEEDFRSFGWNVWDIPETEAAEEIQNTHNAAMAIVARAGDRWAIQGFYLRTLRLDTEYWHSLYSINPLLFHRWMAVVGFSYNMSDEEVAMHALEAYDLETDVVDNPDIDNYVGRHGISRRSQIIQSLKKVPVVELQLVMPWDKDPRFELETW